MRKQISLPLVAVALVSATATRAADFGTAFTYQGHLENGDGPVTDACDFRFGLWDAAAGGDEVPTSPQTVSDVDVEDGVFTVTLDFGAGAIDGAARWLAIEVQCSLDGGFVALDSQRVELTPAPHALVSAQALFSESTPWSGVSDAPFETVTPVLGWGYNAQGLINVPSGPFTAVAGGEAHSLAIRSDGTLAGWGENFYGQIPPFSLDTYIAVAAGYVHSLAIRSDSFIVAWGCVGFDLGQCTVPAGTFTAVAAGGFHSLAIRSDGTLAGWGHNFFGQTNVPLGTFTAVAAGGNHSLAISSDGTLAGWGDNSSGQINVPLGTFTAVAAGAAHSLAIRSDGILVAWGENTSGQINVPSGTFTAVAAGAAHSLAIRSDGTLAGWGRNNEGQINVPSGTFTAVAAGSHHSLAISEAISLSQTFITLGRVGIGTNALVHPLQVGTNTANGNGAHVTAGGTWTNGSSRQWKEHFESIDKLVLLDKLVALPVTRWQYQGEGESVRHVGPTAEDFRAAFGLGHDERYITTIDADGVALAAIQGLYKMVQEKDCEVEELRSEIEDLKELIKALGARQAGGQ